MKTPLTAQLNRFPCGHFDVMSYCRACREALTSPVLVGAAPVGVTFVETAAERRDRLLKKYQELEAQSARLHKGQKFALTLEREKILAEYRIAKQQAHLETHAPRKNRYDKLARLPLPPLVQDVDDETLVPMRNADFLLYVRRRISTGHRGPIPRPKVKGT